VLADSHVHLDRYRPEVVDGMLRRAAAVGAGRLLTVGVDVETSAAAVTLAGRLGGVRAAVGVHPTRVAGLPDPDRALRAVARLAGERGVAAIGEVGLELAEDADAETAARQRRFFEGCLELAATLELPLALHVVGKAGHEATLGLLGRLGGPPAGAVVHYFVGDAALARRYLEAGCHISVGKPVTRPPGRALREAVARAPLERLLLETDTYPLPGRATEPRDVADVCRAVAELRGLDPAEGAARTTENYVRLFG
jgi:TatD DNase family protein